MISEVIYRKILDEAEKSGNDAWLIRCMFIHQCGWDRIEHNCWQSPHDGTILDETSAYIIEMIYWTERGEEPQIYKPGTRFYNFDHRLPTWTQKQLRKERSGLEPLPSAF